MRPGGKAHARFARALGELGSVGGEGWAGCFGEPGKEDAEERRVEMGKAKDMLRTSFRAGFRECLRRPLRRQRVCVPLGSALFRSCGDNANSEVDVEEVWALAEWADLVVLGSPVVVMGEGESKQDDFVCRYELPGDDGQGRDMEREQDVTVLEWEGLMTREWAVRLVEEVVRLSRVGKGGKGGEEEVWAVFTGVGYQMGAAGNVDGWTIVLRPGLQAEGEKEQHEGVESEDQEMEVDMGTEQRGKDESGSTMTKKPPASGLQRFLCLQFVDSVVQ
jgi:hypothetical protein